MKMIDLRYNFFVFLCAYLRQIDLSIDRSRWDKWNNLQTYYTAQISVAVVLDLLKKECGINFDGKQVAINKSPRSVIIRFKELIAREVFKKNTLSEGELKYCHNLLNEFQNLIETDFVNFPIEAEKLRIDIAMFYTNALQPKISAKDFERVLRIEHFMQNSNLRCIEIIQFLKS